MKRSLSLVLALAMLVSMFVGISFTAQAIELPEGAAWQTLVSTDLSEFTVTKNATDYKDACTFKSNATLNNTTVNLDVDADGPSLISGKWWPGTWTGYNTCSAVGIDSAPTEVGTRVLDAKYGGVTQNGDCASPKTGFNISPIYAGNALKAGDKVKITAWVYAQDLFDGVHDKESLDDQTTPFNVRMMVYKPWQSASDTGYNTNGTVSKLTLNKSITVGSWQELTLEYELGSSDLAANNLRIDQAQPTTGTPYAKDLYLGAYKVEKVYFPPEEGVFLDLDFSTFDTVAFTPTASRWDVFGTVDGKQINAFVYADGASYSSKAWSASGDSQIINPHTASGWGFCDSHVNPNYDATNEPALGKIFQVGRKTVKWGGDDGSPKTGVALADLYAGNQVNVGDKIQVTAWVYGYKVGKCYGELTTLLDDQKTPFDVRMFITDTSFNNNGGEANYSYYTKMNGNTWTKLEFTYTVGADLPASATMLKIDNNTSAGNPYPQNLGVAKIKVKRIEKGEVPASGTYTGGYATEEIFKTEVTTDYVKQTDYTPTGSNSAPSTITWARDYDGQDVNLSVIANGAAVDGFWGVGKWSDMIKISGSWGLDDPTNINANYNPVGLPTDFVGTHVLNVSREQAHWGATNGSSAIGIALEDCYGNQYIQAGDKIRITSWIYAYNIAANNLDDFKHPTGDQKGQVDVRMFVSRPWVSESDPGYNTKAENSRLSLVTKMNANEWTKLVLDYTLTEEDLQAGRLIIDNKTADDATNPYPITMAYAGTKVERVLEDGTSLSGTVNLGNAEGSATAKIIVAAYKGNMFKGCQVIDYVPGTAEYDFELTNVMDANSVKAFFWDIDNFAPITKVINLKYVEE